MVKMQKGDVIVLIEDDDIKKQDAFAKHGFKMIEPKKKVAKKDKEADE